MESQHWNWRVKIVKAHCPFRVFPLFSVFFRDPKTRKKCTAVQLKMDCGATIYAPQCKFISTAVRFLTLFSMDFTRVQEGFPHVTNLLKNGGYENWNRTQKIFFGKSSFVQIFYRIFAHLEFSIIKISIHLLKKLTTSHREREKTATKTLSAAVLPLRLGEFASGLRCRPDLKILKKHLRQQADDAEQQIHLIIVKV